MDIVIKENLKVPNCLVCGLSETAVDEEVAEFLQTHGKISRTLRITDNQSEYYGQIIIEFEQSSAVEALSSLGLPFHRPCLGDPTVIHHIQSLASLYSKTRGTTTTKAYLSELKELAKLRQIRVHFL